MSHHLEPVPWSPDDVVPLDGDDEPIRRPRWWRWVALVVAVSMVVATPFAYALYLLLR